MSTNALIIYKSSAGSGKTYTLVMEYLKLVLRKPHLYKNILAITFTNKATEEMKSRIVGALSDLSLERKTEMAGKLSEETGIPVQEISRRASKVLTNILHDYQNFAVSTIDSFFSKLLRVLSRELKIPLRFDLELNTDRVKSEITSMVLDDIGEKKWLKDWLEQFVLEKISADRGWNITHDIENLSGELFRDSYRARFPDGNPGIPESLTTELRKIRHSFESAMAGYGTEFLRILADNGFGIDDVKYKKSGAAAYFRKITHARKAGDYIPGDRVRDAFADPKELCPKGKGVNETCATEQLWPVIQNTCNYFDKTFTQYTSALAVLGNIYQSGIFGALDEKLRIFREENEVLLISDTNHILRKAIEGEDAPFIFEKSGNRYTHFMLDEFQDTSDFQWENLVPLVENALGTGHSALLVGDVKQSIYRWRGGNMQLLLKGVQKRLAHFGEITRIRTLGENYRSRDLIVVFNNRFFSLASALLFPDEQDDFRTAYRDENLHQKWKKGDPGQGYVQVRFIENSRSLQDERDDDEDENSGWTQQACAMCHETMLRLFERGFENRDIALLTRTNNEAKLITAYLLGKGITQILSPESLQLHGSPKIRLLVSLLRYIDDPHDDLALTAAVYGYRRYVLNDETMEGGNHPLAGSRVNKLDMLPENFRKGMFRFLQIPVYEAVEELVPIFVPDHPDAYLQRFLDVVLEYSRKNPPSISGFLSWWDENKDKESCAVVLPAGENAIRVMSIHKSKGLQFPVVIMPFVNWKLKPKPESTLWVSSDEPPFNQVPAHLVHFRSLLEHSVFASQYHDEIRHTLMDQINMLYVAFTRAEEQLYVIAGQPKSWKPGSGKAASNAGELTRNVLAVLHDGADAVDEQGCFESGSPAGPLREPYARDRSVRAVDNWISSPWRHRMQMVVNRRKTAATDPEIPDTAYGVLFHELMSSVLAPADPEEIVGSHKLAEDASEDTRERLLRDIRFFMKSAEQYNWFPADATILTETDLLLPDGTIVRPDRMVISNRHVTIIDYKTGTEEPAHESQVRQYATVLKEMGYQTIDAFLLYPALSRVVQVNS